MLRKWIQFEYIVGFLMLFSIYIFLDFSVMWFFLLLFLPDISILGYLINENIGVKLYNLAHHLSLPMAIFTIALLSNTAIYMLISLIWIAHIFLDRAMGFGLKYRHSFKETHIQKII